MSKIIVVIVCAVLVVVGAGIGLGVFLAPDDLAACLRDDSCETADAIVVVSGGDTNARVDEAVRLYKLGLAPMLLVSGAAADKDAPSNAAVMRDHAVEAGVPAENIILEDEANNTRENAENCKGIIEQKGWQDVILVTSAYHQRRAGMEFGRALGDSAVVHNHPVGHDRSWGVLWWLTPVGWWLALSELTGILLLNVR